MAAGSAKLEVEATANTDRFVRKLRAVSAHADALADELEAIDAEGRDGDEPAAKPSAERIPWVGQA
jgi:hypothetical protein